jgi:hypothetical protein
MSAYLVIPHEKVSTVGGWVSSIPFAGLEFIELESLRMMPLSFDSFLHSSNAIHESLVGAKWETARWPKNLADWLAHHRPSTNMPSQIKDCKF